MSTIVCTIHVTRALILKTGKRFKTIVLKLCILFPLKLNPWHIPDKQEAVKQSLTQGVVGRPVCKPWLGRNGGHFRWTQREVVLIRGGILTSTSDLQSSTKQFPALSFILCSVFFSFSFTCLFFFPSTLFVYHNFSWKTSQPCNTFITPWSQELLFVCLFLLVFVKSFVQSEEGFKIIIFLNNWFQRTIKFFFLISIIRWQYMITLTTTIISLNWGTAETNQLQSTVVQFNFFVFCLYIFLNVSEHLQYHLNYTIPYSQALRNKTPKYISSFSLFVTLLISRANDMNIPNIIQFSSK